ncbi:MAG: MCP four helix bundle domain-containing protein, partial [Janthinobacterium sp.]
MIAEWYTQIFAAVRRTAAIVKSSDPSLTDFFKEDAAATGKLSADLVKQIEPLISGEREKALFAKILEQRKVYSASRDGAVKAKADGDVEGAAAILDTAFTPAAKVYQDLLQELVTLQRESIDATAKQIDASAVHDTTVISLLTLFAVAFGVLCSWLLTTGITRPLRQALALAETVAAGDLTQTVATTAKDETGALLTALGNMNNNLVSIVSQVRSGTDSIATASSEIAAGNLDLSSRTEQQAGSLEETASSMEE